MAPQAVRIWTLEQLTGPSVFWYFCTLRKCLAVNDNGKMTEPEMEFTLRYRCKFRQHWYEEPYETLAEAIESGRAIVRRRGVPAEVVDKTGAIQWNEKPS